jgi:hypothetical protein
MGSQQGNPIGYESAVVNGQLVNVAPAAAFNPLVWGPVYTGAAWQRQGVYVAPPVTPSPASGFGGTGTAVSSFGGGAPAPTATSETGNPFHLTKSPVIWVLVFFAVSLFLLHFVHYKG